MDSSTCHTHRLCVAPMMQCTDRHFRFLARLLSKHSRLYTEMITASALIHGDRKALLEFNECEHPLALQLGGSSPAEMQQCVEYAAEYDYDEVNINAGCPSDRVQAGRFGACLMLEPATVADCIRAMKLAA
ncbi:MAG: tRNA-dihydrouridine synthase, partial [Gammaproteobacteria bacterium]|nr:tRNA-dihydrouridine synthase [Gammaproteobacteria bacterium]